jgi:hypothetical protein
MESNDKLGIPSHRGNDPLQAARVDSNAFNTYWLKSGESLVPIQRVGYAIFSIAFLSIGWLFADQCWEGIRDGDLESGLFAVPAIFFLWIGGLGFRNVFRLKHAKGQPGGADDAG